MGSSIEYYRLHPEKKKLHDRLYRLKHREELQRKQKEYYLNNKKLYQKRRKAYYLKNKDKILESTRYWRQSHSQLFNIYRLRWIKKNPNYQKEYREKTKEQRQNYAKNYYIKNRKRILERTKLLYKKIINNPKLKNEYNRKRRKRYIKNPEVRRIPERLRDARLRAGGNFTKENWQFILNKFDYKCIYCGTTEKLTIEHIIPISYGGNNNLSNIASACYNCNVKRLNFKL